MVKKLDSSPLTKPSSLKPKKEGKRLDKKSLLYLIIAIIVIVLICFGLIYLFQIQKKEEEEPAPAKRSIEDIIKDLTAPQREVEPLPKEVMNSLTAPPKFEKGIPPIPEDVMKSLSAPK